MTANNGRQTRTRPGGLVQPAAGRWANIMKRIIVTVACLIIIVATVITLLICLRNGRSVLPPPGAFLVSVRACEAESTIRVPFKVTTNIEGRDIPIEEIAFHCFTNRGMCQWVDWTTRVIRVESSGYEPREYTVTGKQNIIALLYALEK